MADKHGAMIKSLKRQQQSWTHTGGRRLRQKRDQSSSTSPKGGDSSKNTYIKVIGILATANDRVCKQNLLIRPPQREVKTTTVRPDIVLWSRFIRQVIFVERIVPWETRLEETHERKLAKYHELVTDIEAKNWRTWHFTVDVGCTCFVSQTVLRAFD